jgi:hypothetical protein
MDASLPIAVAGPPTPSLLASVYHTNNHEKSAEYAVNYGTNPLGV